MAKSKKVSVKVSRVVIKLINNDGSYSEATTMMPKAVAEKIVFDVMDWRDNWMASVSNTEKYIKAENLFFRTKRGKGITS